MSEREKLLNPADDEFESRKRKHWMLGRLVGKPEYTTTASKPMIRRTFLFGMASIYIIAFASYYIQAPGLYGDNGLLPVRLAVRSAPNNTSQFKQQPSVLRFAKKFHMDYESAMDFTCWMGIIMGTYCAVTGGNTFLFGLLWLLYMGLYSVGGTFLGFQWDILLMEVGLLATAVAPLNLFCLTFEYAEHDSITIWLIKWLLFKLMYLSGVVKLQSNGPTWWGLVALDWHYESQCIPTSLAWYFHWHPQWFRKLSTAATFIIEIAVPFLFFAPTQGLKYFAFFCQVMLQVLIILTGNYNFFNWLTILLCVSLLDGPVKGAHWMDKLPKTVQKILSWLSLLYTILVVGGLFVISTYYFGMGVDTENWKIYSHVEFNRAQFDVFIHNATGAAIWIGIFCFIYTVIDALVRAVLKKGWWPKIYNIIGVLKIGVLGAFLFSVSVVPISWLDAGVNDAVPQQVKEWYEIIKPFHSVNSYGLFRRMTGVNGRPEVIIEGSLDSKTWLEYEFLYKPGDVNRSPRVVAPHQPRLDWQMWFLALGEWNHYNHWYIVLVHRLFNNEPSVLALMDKNPFPDTPPKYLRASFYKYHYVDPVNATKWWIKPEGKWWRRDNSREFMPTYTADAEDLQTYLKNNGIIPRVERAESAGVVDSMMRGIRGYCEGTEGFKFVMSILLSAWAIVFVKVLINKLLPRISAKAKESKAKAKVANSGKKRN